jgi:hypothetical protein
VCMCLCAGDEWSGTQAFTTSPCTHCNWSTIRYSSSSSPRLSNGAYVDMLSRCQHARLYVCARSFVDPAWYEEGPIDDVVATFQDYVDDDLAALDETYLAKLLDSMLTRTVQRYVLALLCDRRPLRARAGEQMEDDVTKLREFFGERARAKTVERELGLLHEIAELLDCDIGMIPLYYVTVLKRHPDCALHHIAIVLGRRSDLQRQAISDALQQCEAVRLS